MTRLPTTCVFQQRSGTARDNALEMKMLDRGLASYPINPFCKAEAPVPDTRPIRLGRHGYTRLGYIL
jgi:hypothetical protein